MVLQFKKPHSYSSKKKSNFVRFIIETGQLQVLLNNFKPGEAFYVFVALSQIKEIINNRHNLLKFGIALDIYDVPQLHKTRVARMAKSGLVPKLEVADPRKFQDATNLIPLENLCNQFVTGHKGITVGRILEISMNLKEKDSR